VPELPILVLGMPAPVVDADLYVGGRRHLQGLGGRHLVIGADLAPVLDGIAGEPGRVCVLASGDPGFFGIVRALAERFGSEGLDVRPAPSSVSLAFARLGLPWDDAVVVSAHGRPLRTAARRAASAAKAAVLTSPDSPPEALGKELLVLGARHTRAVVCSRLGTAEESVADVDLAGLAAGTWDPVSVVLLLRGAAETAPVLAWGAPEQEFAHRNGMITKAEVRAVALGKLSLPPAGVLWDVGAGSGSVAVECARLSPGLRVIAVDRDVERVRANSLTHGVRVHTVEGEAPAVLHGLPDPDRAFVGGGGLDVLDAVLARLVPGGRAVAVFAALDRAAAAAQRLGHLVQVTVSRGAVLPDGGFRLAAENPVFIAWGPDA
jgi:precorrin-6B C5,15-methyltransferase / cobalt-precorrin-6B C5,C15-methyltransferase